MSEEWRSIDGYPDYEVSSLGRVRRVTGACGTQAGRVLRPWTQTIGYQYVHIRNRDGKKAFGVHALVCRAFHGPAPAGHETRHRNGICDDNREANVCWATPRENAHDRLRHGTQTRGMSTNRTRLQDSDISDIRRRLRQGATQASLCAEYGVGASTMSRISRNQVWRHVQ